MEFEIIKWMGYVISGILGWFIRVLWTAQDQMRKDFTELEKNLPIHYVRTGDFKEVLREMKDSFKEIIHPVLDKLDHMEERIGEQQREVDRCRSKDGQ